MVHPKKVKIIHNCIKCGHKWGTWFKSYPNCCPRCRSYKWQSKESKSQQIRDMIGEN